MIYPFLVAKRNFHVFSDNSACPVWKNVNLRVIKTIYTFGSQETAGNFQNIRKLLFFFISKKLLVIRYLKLRCLSRFVSPHYVPNLSSDGKFYSQSLA